MWKCGGVFILLLAGCAQPSSFDSEEALRLKEQYQVTIRRDSWGVPHVHGATDPATAFGFAYAQSEDAWQLFEDSLPFYRGINGRYNGVDGAATDYLVHMLDVRGLVDHRYEQDVSPEVRAYVQGFVDGMNYYAAKHPEQVDASLLPVTSYDVIAGFVLRHLMFYGFDGVVREVMGPERIRKVAVPGTPERDGIPLGSNAIAVSSLGSSDGSTMLAINSHQPTTGPVAWYEAHISSDEGLNVMGGLFPGSPNISLGFTEDIAWGVTVNGPDLVDVFVLEINPENENQYRLDGEWVDLEVREVDIEVVLWGWLPWTSTQKVYRSVHGPVLRPEHGTYALRFAGEGELRQVEQWYRMNRAKNFDEWRDAMRMHSFASFNFVYADRDSNIFFVHNSLTPERAAGWDWHQYLPGDRSDLLWQEMLSFDDLPQVLNPASGYVHSANQTPFEVSAPADNPDISRYQPEHGFPTRMTNRAHRGLELLENLVPISPEEFSTIKHDKHYSVRARVYGYLQQAFELQYEPGHYADGVALLKRWDLGTDVANPGAALGVCLVAKEWLSERAGEPPPEMKGAFESCVDLIVSKTGQVDPLWGEVNRHVRGEVNVPVGGGPDILRAIYGQGFEENGYHTNIAGDGLYYLVRWDAQGEQSVQGIHQFGSAVLDEDSPHYDDQAAAFAEEALRSPLFEESELEANLARSYSP